MDINTQKFYARYSKAVGKETVNRQQLHLAAEKIKSESRAAAQLPNYAAKVQSSNVLLSSIMPHNSTKEQVLSRFGFDIKPTTIPDVKQINNLASASATLKPKQGIPYRVDLGEPPTWAKNAFENMKETPIVPFRPKQELQNGLKVVSINSEKQPLITIPKQTPIKDKEALASAIKNYYQTKQPKGLWENLVGRLKSFAKTPKGKLGLAIAAATTAIGAATYLYARNKDYGGPISNSSPINDLANMQAQGKINADGSYTVAKGDNLWCIARTILQELHKDDKDFELTDVKIMQYMEGIMQANNLQYEKDSYKVIIQPNQSLKLTA